GGPTTFCPGGSVVLYANTCSGYTYQWQKKDINGVYQVISGATSSSYTVTTAGWYQIRVTSGGSNQWSSGIEAVISATPAAAGTISGSVIVTLGQNGVAYSVPAISGASSYIWTLPSGATIATGAGTNNITVDFLSSAVSGNITVAGTNGTCLGTAASRDCTVNCVPPATPTATSNESVCQSATITLFSTSASNYSWTGPGGFTSSAQNPTRTGATLAMAGNYSVTTTTGGCTSLPGITWVKVADFASITPGSSTTFCSGGTVGLLAETGNSYTCQWIKDNVNISGATSFEYSASTTGNYQVKITDGSCSSWSAPTAVTVNSSLTATITPGGPTSFCGGGFVVLYANTCSGYTYQWQKKDGNGTYQIISGATGSAYTATTEGWYQIRVTSGGVNQYSSGIEVQVNPCKSLIMANDSSDNTTEYFESAYKQDINTLSIYPNPTFGDFMVQIGIPEQTDVTFEVINLLGQSIFKSEKIAASEGVLQRRITMNGENKPGLYIVKAHIGNRIINSKFIFTK
ncbi:MAG: T9SS type A sorting domain-containing protein, partial [Bacteroidetes bacterium]|nr:T9SS type A sorting domain-containing protein [Bacteroidota bacterium]